MGKNELHHGHRERLRQKFIDFGADALLEHELLELALFYPIPRINTNEIAHGLINDFQNISNIFNAPTSELTKSKGIGENSAEFIRLLADVCREYNTLSKISNHDIAKDDFSEYFRNYFINANSGICLLLCTDHKLHIRNKISFTSENILNNNSEIRRIAHFFITNDCTRIVAGINHPERMPVPDDTDFAIIKFLAEKLSVLNIILTDCIICSKNETFSLRQHGAFSFEE